MRNFLGLLFLSFIVTQAYTQQPQFSKLSTYLDSLNESNKFMGTISIFKEGIEIYSKSVGLSDVDKKIKATPQTLYRIGSISKTFTATMIYQAVEKGVLSKNTTLDKYFPEITNSDKITIKDMLCHRSGITTYTNMTFYDWATEHRTRDEMVQLIKECGVSFKPNTKSEYSNSAYILLSFILEDIYKKSYSEILEQNIIKPLNLKNTTFYDNYNGCSSYKFFDKWRVETVCHPSTLIGTGGIVSTPYDLNIFFTALFNHKLISEVSLNKMKTITDHFGKGLIAMPFMNEKGFGHTGGIDGFHSISAYFPKSKISYSLTSNGLNCILNDISIDILKCANNLEFSPPVCNLDLSSKDLDKYLGVYSTPTIPIKLAVTKNGNTLVAQGTGQPSFNLAPTSTNVFEFKAGGIILEFNPPNNTMTLKQGGGVFLMNKE